MTSILETSDDGRLRVRLIRDEFPLNPRREYEHLAYALTVPNRYYLDIDTDDGPLSYGWDEFMGEYSCYDVDKAIERFIRWARIFHGATVTENRPVEGPVSVWYILPGEFDNPKEIIEGEIKEYQQWAEGDVYFYLIEKLNTDSEWEIVDSLSGIYGFDDAENQARTAFAEFQES